MSVEKDGLRLKTGGTLNPRRHIYIKREEDDELLRLLLQGEYCNVLTSRQMGKSSLMIQTVFKLNQVGVRSVTIDMSGEFGTPTKAAEWYLGLIRKISRDLKIPINAAQWWQELGTQTNNQKLLEFFRGQVIALNDSPIVFFLDEIDSTLKLDYRDDLFTALRTMYNERPIVNAYEKVSFCLLGVALPNEIIKDPMTTPYNIGTPIHLRDFDIHRDDLTPLCSAVSNNSDEGMEIVSQIMQWTGGQPYLTTWLCKRFLDQECKSPSEVTQLVDTAFASYEAVQPVEHFQEIARFLTKRSSDEIATLNLYSDIWRGETIPDETKLPHAQLKLSGIAKRDDNGNLVVRNKIYRRVFTETWVNGVVVSLRPQAKVSSYIFISHSSKDDDFVQELREALEAHGLASWVDSRSLRGDSILAPEIDEAIEGAQQVIVVLSPNTVNSPWMIKEIQKALEVERQRRTEGYKVIPVLLPGTQPTFLENWFDVGLVSIQVEIKAGGLGEALPTILAAMGKRLPGDRQPFQAIAPRPVEELTLRLNDLKIKTKDGKRRAEAVAELIYEPADASARAVESRRFLFTAPLGPIEADDLRWYLEDYFIWPVGVFKERAERIEAQLPKWGQALYQSALALPITAEVVSAWKHAGTDAERRFSIFVDSELPDGASQEEQYASREAAIELLSLPWELLHDGLAFLFHGKNPVHVRRRLPNRLSQPVRPNVLPIRILLVSPRPEDEDTRYIDHRISSAPLVEAIESLGELAKITVLTPPTFPALEKELRRAGEAGETFDVVHFDGHGVYDDMINLGGLFFEDTADIQKVERRRAQLVNAERLAAVMRDYRIPLVFLDICKSAKRGSDPTASISARLLQEGVGSVVALSYGVPAETAHRFVRAFYQELVRGSRVGTAMLSGQEALIRDTLRGRVSGAGDIRLQDWFVPVLYQEEQDPQLVTKLLPKEVQQLQARQRRLSTGLLPDPPIHHFHGRSRELLTLERLLQYEPYLVVRGSGGVGKTTLVVELVRWLVRTERFRRAAFVSLEQYTDARSVLDSLGRQLLPEGDDWSVAQFPDLKQALQPVERALRDRPTIIVLDNLESVLPDHTGQLPPGAAPVEELFALCRQLLEAHPATRILFTSREPLPAPFDNQRRDIPLRALSREDAIKLVGEVMKQEGLTPKAEDPGSDPQEITDLVEAVNRHARALVLLAREVARRGVRATTENLHQLMAELDRKHPGDRENSLYASVELSLRRLSPEVREQIKALGVFHGGAHLQVFDYVLGTDADDSEIVLNLAQQLIEVGLAEAMPYGHLRLDPALPPYLLREMNKSEQEEARSRWADGMKQLIAFLQQQQFKDAKLARQLTMLELPNMMAMLLWIQDKVTPEEVVAITSYVEELLSKLGRPQALAQAIRVRENASERLGEWGHARFLTEDANIDRLLERGDMQAVYIAAQQLLKRSLAAGEEAYPSATYDIAKAYLNLGIVLNQGGAAEASLPQLVEAHRRFQLLADAGNTDAEVMVSATITESGDCLRALGRWDEAVAAYQEAIRRAEQRDDRRAVAVNKGQLGSVYLLQGHYVEALQIYNEVQAIFESLGEPGSVATIWHQIGMIYRRAGQFEQAERAYRQSLAISVQQKNLAEEARNLGELGNLYNDIGRLDEAVRCYRQAADIDVKLQDQRYEGIDRSNLAATLTKLQHYDEARYELLRAIECNEPYGHAAELWKTWNILHDLEQATGNQQAAAQARQQAIESYLAYRRAGGQSMNRGAQLCAFAAQAIESGDTTELEQVLDELSGADASPSDKVMLSKVQDILRGDRNPALADDPNLDYDDAVELQLLLEALEAK